ERPDVTEPPANPVQQRDREVREFDPLDRDEKDRKPEGGDAGKKRQEHEAPIPGSVAATEKENAADNPDSTDAPVQEYTGPAVLSRSYTVNRPLIPQQLKWQETGGLSTIYDTGLNRSVLTGVQTGDSGGSVGAQLTWSFVGRHYFRRDQVGLN